MNDMSIGVLDTENRITLDARNNFHARVIYVMMKNRQYGGYAGALAGPSLLDIKSAILKHFSIDLPF